MAQRAEQASVRVALSASLGAMAARRAKRKVVGIDVGGESKGFHAVAMLDGTYSERRQTRSVTDLVRWCRGKIGAQVVAIDAPCRWRTGKEARTAERKLLAQGIRCFLTPSRSAALRNAGGFYDWMLRGASLFRAMEKAYPRFRPRQPTGIICCFETFPHAVTWHLRGANADASRKRSQRLALLGQHGVGFDNLTSMDWIDAALCALAADHLASGERMHAYGDARTGYIVVPAARAAGVGGASKTE